MKELASLNNPRLRDVIAERVSEEAQAGWLVEHRLTTEQRATTLRTVFLNGHAGWRSAFAVMLLLSAGVATFGLSENSAATIIGAMIIGPWGNRLWRSVRQWRWCGPVRYGVCWPSSR